MQRHYLEVGYNTLGKTAAGGSSGGGGGSSLNAVITAQGPIAYWRLGEPSGTTADNEEGTAARDMTYVNTPTLGATSLVSGSSNTAVTFASASSEYAHITPQLAAPLNEDYNWTWTCMASTSTSATQALMTQAQAGAEDRYWGLRISSSGYASVLHRHAGSTNIVTGSTTLVNDGNPHHFAMQVNSQTSCKLFVDGTEEAELTTSAYIDNNYREFGIGTLVRATKTWFMNGTIDEVAVFDTALSDAQIQAQYDAISVSE